MLHSFEANCSLRVKRGISVWFEAVDEKRAAGFRDGLLLLTRYEIRESHGGFLYF